jgi:predicted phage-related endonuclease
MLGVSKYMTRSELLAQKKTGITEDVDAGKQRLFDSGHEAEAKARPIAEGIIGQDLFPMVGVREVDGLPLLASLDGIVMDESLVWETKLWNESLAQACVAGELEPHYWAQLEHQLIVTEAETVLFTTSDGTPERTAQTWYVSVPERRQQVIDGWKQFAQDLATFVPEVTEAKPVGRTPETLPALRIEVTGMVTASNLAEYKAHALAVFESINRELVTDDQFADAEKTIKWAGDVESRLAAAKQHALSQTASIDELFRTIDDISAEARRVRLDLDKLVKARKDTIRLEIVTGGAQALSAHLESLNKRLGKSYMPSVPADFAGAIKNKRTLESMRDSVATALANSKIEASAIADRIQANLTTLRELGADHTFLFSDTATIVLKAPDDLHLIVKSRIADHKAAEVVKEEATRVRIQAEEQAKAQAAADAEIAAAKLASEEAIAKAAQPAPVVVQPAQPMQPVVFVEQVQIEQPEDTGATMRLGQIADRLGFVVTADFLSSLGFEPSATEKNAKLYKTRLFPLICRALVSHINSVCEVDCG